MRTRIRVKSTLVALTLLTVAFFFASGCSEGEKPDAKTAAPVSQASNQQPSTAPPEAQTKPASAQAAPVVADTSKSQAKPKPQGKDESKTAASASQPNAAPAPAEPLTVEQAAAAIKKASGNVVFDDKLPGKPAVRVFMKGPLVTDEALAPLQTLKTLKFVQIVYFNAVTSEGMIHVATLPELESLFLEGTKIGNKGLEHLKRLTNLTRLELMNTDITDDGLVHLAGLSKLKQLTLSFNDVTDAGLENLKDLTSLASLDLDDTKVTEAGVNKLKQSLPKLRVTANVIASASKTGPAANADAGGTAPMKVAQPSNGDWPQWRGPNRDGLCGETGLLQEWPEGGPKLLWEAKGVEYGFSTVAIQNGKAYVAGCRNDTLSIACLDAATGEKQWQVPVAKNAKYRSLSTPTVDGEYVYALSWEGDLVCVHSSDGSEVWRLNLMADLGGVYMARNEGGGYSESVLIDGDRLICTPGAKDAALAALDKRTGKTIWKAAYPADVGTQGKDAAGMSSAVISNACGIKQYVQFSGRGLISVAAEDGKTLWAYNGIANNFSNIPTPIVAGDYVFASTVQGSDPGGGAVLLKLVPDNGGVKAEVVYRLDFRTVGNHHGGMVLVGNHVYMGHGYNRGFPLCLEFMTGKAAWRPGRGPGTGSASVLYADGHLYFHYEDGVVALVEAKPEAYVLKGKFKLPPDKDKDWAHLVISDGRLYVRGQDRLLCYDIKQPESAKTGQKPATDQTEIVVADAQPVAPPPKPALPPGPTIEEATAELKKIHCKIDVDEKNPEKPVVRIRFQDPDATDAKMAYLKPFTTVKLLEIVYFNNITDAGMVHVAELTNLERLYIDGTRIGDAGLEPIKGLTKLRRLDLINTHVTDAGLVHLAGLSKLQHLNLSFTEVSDAGLEHLKGLTNLRDLVLDDTKVTEAGVSKLKQALPKCQILAIATDAAGRGGKTRHSETQTTANDVAPSHPIESATGDWPQWRGPNRDGLSMESGLLSEWPAEGPPLLWEIPGIGWGYSTVAIQNGKAFVTGSRNGKTYLTSFDPVTGKQFWQVQFADDGRQRATSTPTADGDFVYALAFEGELVCARAADGSIVWRRNFAKDFGGVYQAPGEGGAFSESVLIDGDHLICTPGAKDAALAALNKHTGETIWKAAYPADVGPQGKDAAGFSSAVISNACGIRQYVQLSGRGLIGVAADDGRTLWAYNGIANTYANISTPIVTGDYVFASTVHSADPHAGTVLLKLVPENGGAKPEVVYRLTHRTAANHHGGMVLVGDYVYMGHGYNRGFPLCLELKTGKVMWRPGRGPGSGSASVVYADGNLYFRYEDGAIALIEATPTACNIRGQFKIPEDMDKDWAHPVVSHGRLYLRGQNKLKCFDISRK